MLLETLAVKLVGDVADFVGKMNTAAGAITAVGDKMQAVGQRMQSIGQQWSLYVSAPLIALGKTALDSAADFEQSMNVMQQVSGATGEQMNMLSKQALQLGKDTVFGAGEAAAAQLTLAKAGFEVGEILDATTGVINMAAAADMGLAEAADVTASAVRAFNLEAKDSTRISDMLAAAANNSTAGVHDMALALKMSSAVMAQYGFTAEETVTMLAQLANAGMKSSDAGTSLKVAFMRLAAPTDEAARMMGKYGISIYDANGAMRSASDIIQQFTEKLGPNAEWTRRVGGASAEMGKNFDKANAAIGPLTNKLEEQRAKLAILQQELAATTAKFGEGSTQVANKQLAIMKLTNQIGETEAKYADLQEAITIYREQSATATEVTTTLTEKQRNQALETIFGTDAIRTMNVLMAQGIDAHTAMAAAVTEQGAAQEVANARMKGLAGAIEYFKGTIDSLMIETALPWLNTLSDLIRQTADWTAKFGELDPAAQRNIVIMGALAAAIGPVLIVGGLLVQSVGSLISAFGALSAFIFANPIVAIVALGAAAAAFAAAWNDNWGGVREKTAATLEFLFTKLNELDTWIRTNVPEMGPWLDAIRGFTTGAKEGFDIAFPAMIQRFNDFGRTITSEVPKLVGAFGRLWSAVFGGREGEDPKTAARNFTSNFMNFLGVLSGAVGTIISQIRIMIDSLAYAIEAVKSFLSGDWDKAATSVGQFTKLMQEFSQVTGAQYQTFLDFMNKWEESAKASQPTPGLASGGWVGRDGRYMVGEVGPELVDLPAGAYVHNARDTAKMSGVTITLNQSFSGNPDRNAVASGAQMGILQGLRQVGLA